MPGLPLTEDASNSRDVDFLQRPLIRRLKPTAMDKAPIKAARLFRALSLAVRLSERMPAIAEM